MKNAKRTLALLLTLCMVIPMCLVNLASTANAAPIEKDYNFVDTSVIPDATTVDILSGTPFTTYYASLATNYANGTTNALFIGAGYGTNSSHRPKILNNITNDADRHDAVTAFKTGGSGTDYFMAFLLKSPGDKDATYKLNVDFSSYSAGANTINVYLFPATAGVIDSDAGTHLGNCDYTTAVRTALMQYSTTNGALTKAVSSVIADETYLRGTIDAKTNSHVVNDNAYVADVALKANTDYVVVFKTVEAGYIIASGVNLTEVVQEYTVSVDANIVGGTVEVGSKTAVAGDTVTVTATPDEGFELVALTVTDANGDPVDVTDGAFTMPDSNVSISAVFVRDGVAYVGEYDFSIAGVSTGFDAANQANFVTLYNNYHNGTSNNLFVGTYNKVTGTLKSSNRPKIYIGGNPYSGANLNGLYMPSRIDLSNPSSPIYDFVAVMINAPKYDGNYKIELDYYDYTQNAEACEVYMIPASQINVTVGDYTGPINGINPNETSVTSGDLRYYGDMTAGIAAALSDEYLVGTVDLCDTSDKSLKTLYVGHQVLNNEEYVAVFRAVATKEGVTAEGVASGEQTYDANNNQAMIILGGMTLTETFGETYFTQDGEEKYFESVDAAVEYVSGLNAETTVKLSTSINTALSLAVNAGVTLDLNGNNLSVDYVTAFGQIKDSATDDNDGSRGVLTTAQVSTFNPENSYFPLKVAENSYSFFKAEVKELGTKAGSSENDRMFGLRLLFADEGAYALLGEGNGLTVRVNLYVGGEVLENGSFWFSGEVVDSYIGLEQELTGRDAALILTVKNIHVAAGQEVRVKMTFTLDDTYSVAGSVRYEVPTAVTE